jgi:pimeloyl-ACP methyl ester carboxylesterase
MKKRIFLTSTIILIIIVLLGPKPDTPYYQVDLPQITNSLRLLADSIARAEADNPLVKPNNEARIVWADSAYRQTNWAIVYLHGFSASQMEGDPIHREVAEHFDMNLYLARLSDHGLLSDSALVNLTPDRLWESARLALVIGRKLGKKVILMSTSTGGTLALKLAAQYPDKVDALINYSPNIRINNAYAGLMNNSWGLNILKFMSTDGYVITTGANDSIISQYWNTKYRIEALPQLEELVETTMTKDVFKEISCPSLTIAYYKDEEHQDPTVKVSAMQWMHESLATANDKKRYVELADVGVHPLASGLRSKDLASVKQYSVQFVEEILGVSAKRHQ